MPISGVDSLCDKHALYIVSRDQKNKQYHKGKNVNGCYVTHYRVDGDVIRDGSRCDFLLINEDAKIAYLVELKGSDLVKALAQLENTEYLLGKELRQYSLQYRIVANKCKTQETRTSAYRKYQIKWKGRLVVKSGFIEEEI